MFWRASAARRAAEARSVGRQEYGILDTLGNLGDFIGGIAVIVTLAYLAFQLRQTTETVRANSVRELTENIARATEALMTPENTEMYLRGARSYSSLTTDDKLRFGLLLGLFLARFDTVLEYRERRMVDDAYVAFHSDAIRIMFEYSGVREWCKVSRQFQGLPARVKVWLGENVGVEN